MSNRFSITLPSGCQVYPGVDPSKITIRPFTGREEKAIAEITADNFDKKFQVVLASVLEGIDPNILTLGDRKFIMLWLAINSYSPKYPVEFVCDNCSAKLTMEADLSEMQVLDLVAGFKEPYPVELSDGKTVHLRLLRVEDEISANALEKSGQNVWLYRYAASIVGEGTVLDKSKTLESYLAKDVAKIRAFHETHEHGPVMESKYTCDKCGGDGIVAVPFRIQMFFPYGESLKRYFGTPV
jgi:hypothetical protein